MYSFFSRHEVDKKGKDWNNAENPSNGKIMWLAWGGDAGFSWSRKIVNREKNMKKSIFEGIAEEIKDILSDVVNPVTETIEMQDDIVEKMDGQTDIEVENKNEIYKSDNEDEDKWDNSLQKCWTGYKQVGMKEKGGRMVPNCVPVEKADKPEDMPMTEEERRVMMTKDIWGGYFSPDLQKRNFNTAQRKKMAEQGHAMPDGSYPIGNKNDLMNAIRSWGRGGADPKVKAHIKRRAKELGAEDMIPENWK